MSPEERLQATIRQLRAGAWYAGSDREDLAQEALCRAVQHGISTDALPWLRTVQRRIAIDRSRRAQEIPSGSSGDLDDLLPSPQNGPEDHVVSEETVGEIRRALEALPPRYRDALIAYLEEGQRPARLADRLGLSPNATWTLLSRARSRLRMQLERAGVVPSMVWFRMKQWAEPAVTCGVALGVAAAITVGGSAPADSAPGPAPVMSIAEARDVLPMPEAAAAIEEPPVAAAEPVPTVAAPPPGPEVKAPLHYQAEICVPGEEGRKIGGEVWYEPDEEETSLLDPVIEVLPEPIMTVEEGGCD